MSYECVPVREWVKWDTRYLSESRFRRLDAPELLEKVMQGVRFVDGVKTANVPQEAAA